MIGSDTLLFPDTGADFLRSLRTAALYSKQVHVLTMADETAFRWAEKFIDEHKGQNLAGLLHERLYQYSSFLTENRADLLLLKDEGVLVPFDAQEQLKDSEDKAKGIISQRLKAGREKFGANVRLKPAIAESLDQGFDACPPSYFDFEAAGSIAVSRNGADPEQDERCRSILELTKGDTLAVSFVCFMKYSLMLSVLAESRGVGLMSWSTKVRDTVWMMRERFSKSASQSQSNLPVRQNAEAVLGQMILEKYLPALADDAPFEEILKIRESCADELEAFRVGIAEVAAQVDPTKWREDSALQARDLIATRVDPAVQDLKESLKAPRRAALSNVWLAATPIAVGLSFIAGASLDLVAAIGLLGTGIQMLDGSGEPKKLHHASQWSILLGKNGGG